MLTPPAILPKADPQPWLIQFEVGTCCHIVLSASLEAPPAASALVVEQPPMVTSQPQNCLQPPSNGYQLAFKTVQMVHSPPSSSKMFFLLFRETGKREKKPPPHMYVVKLLIGFQTSFKGSYNILLISKFWRQKTEGACLTMSNAICPDGSSSSPPLNSVYYPPRPPEATWQPRSANSEAVCASPPFLPAASLCQNLPLTLCCAAGIGLRIQPFCVKTIMSFDGLRSRCSGAALVQKNFFWLCSLALKRAALAQFCFHAHIARAF